MDFFRRDGVVLHYRLTGPIGAPALALVNSLGTDARIWDGVIAALSGRFRILSYDKRGHGLSDVPEGDYALADHVDDLAALLDHAGIGTLALGGVSVGGLIAQGFALAHPQRIKALMLCNTAPRIGDDAMWNTRIADVRQNGMAALADPVMQRWLSPGFRAAQPDALSGWRNMFLRTDPAGYIGTCATLRDTDLRAAISAITAPTLVVAGSDDLATPPDLVRTCADSIAGARFEILDGVGHIPSIEKPALLAGMFGHFLSEVRHG